MNIPAKSIGIPWWIRVILWFKPTYVGCDWGSLDEECVITAKWFRGRLYILDIEKRPGRHVRKK